LGPWPNYPRVGKGQHVTEVGGHKTNNLMTLQDSNMTQNTVHSLKELYFIQFEF